MIPAEDSLSAGSDQTLSAPFFEALQRHVTGGVLGLAMPGHAAGRGAWPPFQRFVQQHGLAGDITQVLGMDDLQRPTGVCGEAQRAAAAACGADQTWFLVNGASGGVHAMLLAALRPGETLLLPRNCHRSAFAGALLAGVRTRFVQPPFDANLGVGGCLQPEQLEAALNEHSDIRAVLVTSPTYHGAAARVDELARIAHHHEVPLLVDEAWGAHLPFHPDLPRSAVAAGADLVVHSTHKLLAGMSQAAMLHRCGRRVDPERVEQAVSLLQTTSPNTLLVASLDTARLQMQQHGHALWSRALGWAARVRSTPFRHLECPPCDDPTRLLINLAAVGWSGYEAEQMLRERHNLQVEMADARCLICLALPAWNEADAQQLVAALHDLDSQPRAPLPPPAEPFFLPDTRLTLREAFHAPQESVPWDQAAERVSAELIAPYPPGIPALLPGEVIAAGMTRRLRHEAARGAMLQGARDPQLNTVRVVRAEADRTKE